MSLPANCTLTCSAKSLSALPALVTPASPEMAVMQGAPVGKLYDITFASLHPTLAEGDLLVDDSDATKRYRIRGAEHWDVDDIAHTHCLADGGLT